jgi:hypothetical protein
MFESFVIGPVAGNRLGVVRQCIECVTAAGPGARPCEGFGPGCLSTPVADVSPASPQAGSDSRRSR